VDEEAEDYTYFLKDKKVKVEHIYRGGGSNVEYSWYVK
jgi:hypothetical protein